MNKILLSPPHLTGREMDFLRLAMDANWIAPEGPCTAAFEKELSAYLHDKPVVALNAGTAALHLAMRLLEVDKDDIVVCQSLTFAATVFPVCYQKATPVFVDSEPETWNIDPYHLQKCLEYYCRRGKKPKAVIGVHVFGMPLRLTDVLEVCNRYEVPFLEDAAEAQGSVYRGRQAGSFGTMAVLSFNGNKMMTTSAGGALVLPDERLRQRACFLASQAKDQLPYYCHSEVGYNYRMSNLCAAIGLAQLEALEERVQLRRRNFDYYQKMLGAIPGIAFQPERPESRSNRWLTVLRIHPGSGATPETLHAALAGAGIASRYAWNPMHLQPVFKGAGYWGARVAESIFSEGLCLPSGSGLTEEELARIVGVITAHLG